VRAPPDFEYIHKELRKKHMTLMLVWQEYKAAHADDGYQYSQFCTLYREWARPLDAILRQNHKAGDKVFVDWSGDGIMVTDPLTGVASEMPLFVGVLGASGYAFAKAAPSRESPHWIRLHSEMLESFGGVPAAIVPDNEKTGVKSPCRYDPDLNPVYAAWAEHYKTAVIPTRPGKPRDKALVENGVLNAQRWILAALRNHTFFGLDQANGAIAEKLVEYNDRTFQKMDTTRRKLFESVDKPVLRALPPRRFEHYEWARKTVNIDYHVIADERYYSVPYTLIGKKVEVHWTATTVEVLYNHDRVALHQRSFGRHWEWISNDEHRPPAHRAHLEWTPERIVKWAATIGAKTSLLVERILASRAHPEQGYRVCLGIIRLGKQFGNDRLDAACSRALALNALSYRSVCAILDTGSDHLPLLDAASRAGPPLPSHDNIRGPEYYH
jgi:transposase